MCRSLPVSLRLNSSTQPSSMMRSPLSADKPVVSVSRTMSRLMGSVIFLGVVDRVFRDLDRQVGLGEYRLATQARLRLQAPGAVEQVFLALLRLVERLQPAPHDHVAGGAGAAHLAGVLDVDVVVEQGLADRGAGRRADLGALRAVLGMGKDLDRGHRSS